MLRNDHLAGHPEAITFIDTAAVAVLLGQTPGNFLRQRRALEDQAGFPLPMPHWQRPLKWRADQVRGWIAAQGRPREVSAPRPSGANVVLLDMARGR